jgi:hypothetical protein
MGRKSGQKQTNALSGVAVGGGGSIAPEIILTFFFSLRFVTWKSSAIGY